MNVVLCLELKPLEIKFYVWNLSHYECSSMFGTKAIINEVLYAIRNVVLYVWNLSH